MEAYLANVYFCNDPHRDFRTTCDEWTKGIERVENELGVSKPAPYVGNVFLEAVA